LENVILVANCIGGSASLLYTIKQPEMVDKLLIFNICPGNLIVRFPPMRKYISYLNKRKRSKSIFGSVLSFGFTKTPIKRKFPRILFGKAVDKESPLYNRYIEKFKLKTQTTSRINLLFSVHTFNALNYLGKEKAPEHLLVWGEHNSVTSLKNHGYFHFNLLQSSQFEIVKNAGHLCMYEQPEATNTLIEDYISAKDVDNLKKRPPDYFQRLI
jgi:pimeloyl-ACP methyl ester carboxylesterase